jgi:plasmid replication initiation protein
MFLLIVVFCMMRSMNFKNSMVCKSNAVIDAGYRLSIAEQRIILACIAQVDSRDEVTDEVMYSVTAEDLADVSGIALKTSYDQLKAAALQLKHRDVRIIQEPNSTRKRRKVLVTGWVQTVAYVENEARVELRFSKDILPYLSELKSHFTRYKLAHVASMKSSYGIRLYELLVQWQNVGEREIELDWLREQFQIQDLYPRMFDFKKRVLQPALNDINAHSNFWVTCDQRKSGRRVTHLRFQFGEKTTTALPKKSAKDNARIRGISRAEIEAQARPGESYEEVALRLSRQR